ncbi:MAG TPA: signal peptidase II [Terriglobales bacterium]|nr:signal peptidase II [Terriglobales bacterium]
MSFACGIGILLADQWSKRTVQVHRAHRSLGIVRFKFVPHRDNSYERTGTRAALVLTWVLALACAVILYRFGAWFQGGTSLAGLGLAFGGAASNLVDILQHRSVINFIDLGWWPVFNLADVAILAGLAAAFLG